MDQRYLDAVMVTRRTFLRSAASGLFVPALAGAQAFSLHDVAFLKQVATNASFDPTAIAGLKAWWKADSLSLNDGDAVSTWDTAGGPAISATGSGSNRPTFKTNIKNGRPVIRFSRASSQVLSFTTFTIPTFTFFAVYSVPSGGAAYDGLFQIRNSGIAGFQINSELSAGYMPLLTITNSSGTETSNTKKSANNAFPTPFRVDAWASTQALWINGVSASTSAGSTGFASTGGFIGRAYSYITADIAEIVLYDSVLSAGDRALVEQYLNGRWALY